MPHGPGSGAPLFRADHVGSLLRPAELRRAHRALSEGSLTEEGLRALQDRSIRDAVALQEESGLKSITDGEFRRASYWSHFVDCVEGMSVAPARFTFQDSSDQQTEFLAPHTNEHLKRETSISGDELDFLLSATRETAKITLPSPPTMHFWRGAAGVDSRAYPDPERFFEDLAAVYRQEIEDLAGRGARYIQIDEVPLAMLCDPDVRLRLEGAGESPDDLVDRYLALIEASLPDGVPQVTVAMHLCRGNYKGRWLSKGGYDPVAERLFSIEKINVFLLEYDTPRAGDFAPLRHMPPGKRAMLGLVSTKTPELENIDDLVRTVENASRHLDIDQLGICPQCGFASTVGGNPITVDDEKRKLALVCKVAEQVWPQPTKA